MKREGFEWVSFMHCYDVIVLCPDGWSKSFGPLFILSKVSLLFRAFKEEQMDVRNYFFFPKNLCMYNLSS